MALSQELDDIIASYASELRNAFVKEAKDFLLKSDDASGLQLSKREKVRRFFDAVGANLTHMRGHGW